MALSGVRLRSAAPDDLILLKIISQSSPNATLQNEQSRLQEWRDMREKLREAQHMLEEYRSGKPGATGRRRGPDTSSRMSLDGGEVRLEAAYTQTQRNSDIPRHKTRKARVSGNSPGVFLKTSAQAGDLRERVADYEDHLHEVQRYVPAASQKRFPPLTSHVRLNNVPLPSTFKGACRSALQDSEV